MASIYFVGEKPMNIDFCVWPHLERVEALRTITSELAITQKEFPQLRKWIELITAVPAVKDTMFSTDIHLQFFQIAKSGKYDCDIGLEE